jgi:hypothetical protein
VFGAAARQYVAPPFKPGWRFKLSKRFIATIVGALALAALAAGCGGGGGSEGSDSTAADSGGSDTNGAPALTKAEFIKQGDEICTKNVAKFAKAVTEFMNDNGIDPNAGPSQEQEEELLSEVVLPQFREEAEELDALGPPKGEEQEVEEIISGVEEIVAEGEEDPSTVTGSDDPFADVNQKAKDFGFKVCSQS